jgi:hypothetical protein
MSNDHDITGATRHGGSESPAKDAFASITGIAGLPTPTKVQAIAAMFDATKMPASHVSRFVLRVTPEDARLIRRDELIEEYRSLGLYSLAKALLRRPARASELCVVACGDHGPRFRAVSVALLRVIFSHGPVPATVSEGQKEGE